ncbi:MAG: hypothetical protein GX644_16815 [Limnobacter sp.]|nr:hypothetical protein [Limnobacter sp.]
MKRTTLRLAASLALTSTMAFASTGDHGAGHGRPDASRLVPNGWTIDPPGALSTNGLQLNGLQLNGLHLNGLHLNGLHANGLHVNGLHVNGLHSNGLQSNGRRANGLHVGESRDALAGEQPGKAGSVSEGASVFGALRLLASAPLAS